MSSSSSQFPPACPGPGERGGAEGGGRPLPALPGAGGTAVGTAGKRPAEHRKPAPERFSPAIQFHLISHNKVLSARVSCSSGFVRKAGGGQRCIPALLGLGGTPVGQGWGAPRAPGPPLTLSLLQPKQALRKGFVTLAWPCQPAVAHGGALSRRGVCISFTKHPVTEVESLLLRWGVGPVPEGGVAFPGVGRVCVGVPEAPSPMTGEPQGQPRGSLGRASRSGQSLRPPPRQRRG